MRTNCYRLPSGWHARRSRHCRQHDVPAASAPVRLFARLPGRAHAHRPRHSCTRCGAPFGDLLCTECSVEGTSSAMAEALDRCLACAVYAHPLPRIIKAYKDAGERRLAPYLAELLYDTALHAQVVAPERLGGVLSGADAVVFVPATAAAFRRRGFDHMELLRAHFASCRVFPCSMLSSSTAWRPARTRS